MAKAKNYKGFGEVHGLREWARLLDVNKDTLRYWLATKKVSIEEFATQNGISYTPTFDDGRTRVNRLAQAQELLGALFERSGYDPARMTTELTAGKRIQKVFYDNKIVGEYNLDTGALRFDDSVEGLNLIDFPVPDPMLYYYPPRKEYGIYGLEDRPAGWGVHPETRAVVVNRILGQQ